MDRYNTLEFSIIFYNQRNKGLGNVKYKLVFISTSGNQQIFADITNDKGRTKPILLTQNGKLQIFVEGYETIFSQKKLIKPKLASGDNIIEIKEKKLEQNLKFITKQQYDIKQQVAKKNLEELKKIAAINSKSKIGNFYNYSKITPPISPTVKKNLEESQNLSYEEYKKRNTHLIKKSEYLKFKTYVMYRFVDNKGNGIPIIDYQIFGQGKNEPIVNMKPAKVDGKGFTQLAETHLKTQVKYRLGSTVKESEWFEPITCVDKQLINKIIFPLTTGITNTDPNNKVGLGASQKPPIVINPHTNEVLVLPPAVYAEFDRKTQILSDAVKKVHQSNAELTRAIQDRKLEEIKELESRLNINQEKAIEKINGEFQQYGELKEVWVVESTGKVNQSASKYNLKRRYLKVTEYEELKRQRRNNEVRADIVDPYATQYTPQRHAQIQSSFEKLGQQLLTAKGSIGSEEKAVYNLIGGLGGEIAKEYKDSRDINVSTEAQWMRMVAGASGEGMISASSKGVTMKLGGDASTKWTLFEGVKEWRKFFPCESGWKLEYDNYDLGTIRFLIGAELAGFSGANLGISGNLSVDITHQGTTQMLKAMVRKPERSMSQMFDRQGKPMFQPAQGSLNMIAANQENAKNQANAGIKVFAGAQVQGKLKGGIEWFKPNNDKGGEGEFVSIASVAGGGGVSLGAGAEGQYQIGYDEGSGNFKILVAAHLCWGIGAKGVAEFTVGSEHILNYLGFIKLQLLQASFRTLVYIHGEAFSLMARVLAYCIGENYPLTQNVQEIADAYDVWLKRLNKDHERLKTANNINSAKGREELIYATPETKGILLYAVTHWSDRTAPIFDIYVSFSEREVELFPARKTAVINILKTCVTTAEWQNTIQHIHPKAKKLNPSEFGKVEGDLIRFLNYGDDDKYAEDLIRCINSGIEYVGQNINKWLKDYLKYRKGAKAVTGTSWNYMLVQSQDDNRFRQFELQQGIQMGFEEQSLMASNLEILAPFEQNELKPTVYHV
ncbi:hypothetical protein [Acinetobacter kanungonis]|uniref:hypothetical protein n=1 Tax=Acinetobacter kanungonis TaxID=2699469 RepID=UPI00137B8595|nr:hypothetical protein [Acinetobacter kanungonis]NCI77059.1 hypothetical protein [Acinetobacter kanungonis]